MFKLNFLKRNTAPIISNLHPKPARPGVVWTRILSIGAVMIFVTALVSAYFTYEISNDDVFGDKPKEVDSGSVVLINADKLNSATQMIKARTISN